MDSFEMDGEKASSAVQVGYTYKGRPRTCGFRFSVTDGVAVLLCVVATYVLWPAIGPFSLLLPYVLGHFFLFCNVFRVRRRPEVIWAAIFVVNFAVWVLVGGVGISGPFLTQLPVTVVLVALECRQPTYHGVCSRIFNARDIERYLRGEIP